jgi:hypothetical protein
MRINSVQPARSDNQSQSGDHISRQSMMIASTLSGHMGIEEALQVSTKNQWHGVVAALQEMQLNKHS